MEDKMRKEKKGKGNASKENEIEEHQGFEDPDEEELKISKGGATTTPPMRETLETIENSNNSD